MRTAEYRSRSTSPLLSALAALTLLAAACGAGADTDAAESGETLLTTAPSTETEADPGDEAALFPRTVADAVGEVTIDDAPERVVALDQSTLDVALVLGLEVIGHTTYLDPDGPIPPLYGEVGADLAADSVWVGDLLAPNLEKILTLEPDVILTSAVRHESIADELAQIAPTVMTESAGAGWKESLALIAEATGRETAAAEALAAYEARAAAVGAAINAAHGDPTLSVVRFVDVIRLYQPLSFSGIVLSDAGLARPESQQDTDDFITVISEEELALADADWLVYAVYPDENVEAAVAERQAGPLWTSLRAVAAGQAFAVDDGSWMSGVGLFGANAILDDLETIFDVAAG